ncbi:glycoside hydrolase family 37 protein [Sphaerobolus stellatus SS14]|nr:glycoside hydrolase family 37 protein [Sphaerobolus stellatus SS14]
MTISLLISLADMITGASEAADLFAELASGAETGWDYSRWMKNPSLGNTTFSLPQTRMLNVRNTTDAWNVHVLLADLYDQSSVSSSSSLTQSHRSTAALLRTAILDLFWDSNKLAFYDFNCTSKHVTRFGQLRPFIHCGRVSFLMKC